MSALGISLPLVAAGIGGALLGFLFGWYCRSGVEQSRELSADALVEQHTVVVLDPPTWRRYEAMILAGHPVLVERGHNVEGV